MATITGAITLVLLSVFFRITSTGDSRITPEGHTRIHNLLSIFLRVDTVGNSRTTPEGHIRVYK